MEHDGNGIWGDERCGSGGVCGGVWTEGFEGGMLKKLKKKNLKKKLKTTPINLLCLRYDAPVWPRLLLSWLAAIEAGVSGARLASRCNTSEAGWRPDKLKRRVCDCDARGSGTLETLDTIIPMLGAGSLGDLTAIRDREG